MQIKSPVALDWSNENIWPSAKSVNGFGTPPFTDWVQRFDTPPDVTTYIKEDPSDVHLIPGHSGLTVAGMSNSRTGGPPLKGINANRQVELDASSRRKHAISFPSGEMSGCVAGLSESSIG